ncbi:MAG: cytochrome c oxidase subunit I [Clostridia bacterium]|nr:cytochrome c oxidase subunit I [Clostridia bacterium]
MAAVTERLSSSRSAAHAGAPARTGLWSWITTVDHKRIGILYLIASAFFFTLGGIEAFLMRVQLMKPGLHLFVGNTFNELLTMHGTTMIFFAVMPLFTAFVNAVVPLQIGARDVAFPFLNALSFWLFFLGGILFNSSWIIGGAPNNGWFNYAPNSEPTYTPGTGIDFYDIGLQIAGLGTFISGINFIVTIINMRAPGMTLRRMPLFTWATLVMSIVILFAFPAITVDLFLNAFDRLLGMNFFNVNAGGNVILWQHLFWIFGHPEVYILALPAFGIISEVVSTFSRKTLFGYDSMVLALLAIGFLSFMVWSHHMFAVGMGPVVNSIFALSTMTIAVPTGIKIFNWIMTMWGGRIRTTTAMMYAIGFIPIFVIGGMSGVMVAMAPADYQYNMSYFVVAHFHYVMIGGSLFALLAALYYWFPKMFGRMLDEGLGKLGFWLVFIGFNVTFFPMHLLGLLGMPRRIFTYKPGLGLETWNFVSTIGVFILTLGFLTVLINVIRALMKPADAPADPWDARTLEWSIPSPAPEYNFAQLPEVRARDAWWFEKRNGNKKMPAATPLEPIHMPSPTPIPFYLSVGVTIIGYGAILSQKWLLLLGLALTAVMLYRGMFHVDPGYHVTPREGEAA